MSIRNRLISSSFAVVGRLYCRALPKSWLSLVRASRELPGVVFHSRSKLANTKSLFLTIGAPTLNPSVLFRIAQRQFAAVVLVALELVALGVEVGRDLQVVGS